MKTPLERVRFGAFVLAAVVVLAITGYVLLGYNLVEAIWMVVITISSVGYGERSAQGPVFQLFTVGVIVLGMSAAAYTLGGLVQLLTQGEVERVLGIRRMTREIERLTGHVIVCGYGRMGQLLTASLRRQKLPFLLVDRDPKLADDARQLDYLVIAGDATVDSVLLSAGIQQAKTLVTVLPSDADNVFITLTARNLCPQLQIIARAEQRSTESKLRQAGADKVVMPALVGARQLSRLITHPATADLIELVQENDSVEFQLEEIELAPKSRLVGATVRDTEAHRKHRLLVAAIKQADGNMVFNPDADHKFAAGDVVIIMGRADDLERFQQEYGL